MPSMLMSITCLYVAASPTEVAAIPHIASTFANKLRLKFFNPKLSLNVLSWGRWAVAECNSDDAGVKVEPRPNRRPNRAIQLRALSTLLRL
jgi:hypothetical protein